jgi:co-chaperonin GroES (HSP10)
MNEFASLGGRERFTNAVHGNIRALGNNIIVDKMNFGERKTTGGIVLTSDDGKDSGIRPRWAQVYAVGPEQSDVKVGQWILIEHGRWTREFTVIGDDGVERVLRRADPEKVLAIYDDEGDPPDNYFGAY